ncbi:hypothetical protein [Streptomyces jumonjinensis]|uniref:Uncharacterized protein n=1 Tax=Streptomyces jumonjinensis TaxID=1945 RepID=A0A646KB60_STRJU|nr:hypothetical protein [Streptomyces jumonjinensis]MQS99454.1 hypothetical protein [Streptomyces jumonjinensis]
MTEVRVETEVLDAAGSRRIATSARATCPLGECGTGVEAAILQASETARRSLDRTPERDGWQISGMEVTFGLTPAAGGGGSPSPAAVPFEVQLTVERLPGMP